MSSNSMILGGGFYAGGPDRPLPAAPTVTAANNGVSLSGTTVVLGNNVGDAQATLLSDREIPNAGFFVAITGTGNLLLNSTTDQSEKLQVNGTILQYDEQAPVTDYAIIDILGTSILSDRPGATLVSSGGNVGIGFVNNQFTVTINPAILVTQTQNAENVFIMDVPNVGGAGELGMFANSGNGFIGTTTTIMDNGCIWQIQGNCSIEAELGVGVIPTTGSWIAVGPGDQTKIPFLYQAGTPTTIPVNGAKEFDGNNETIVSLATRYTLAKTLRAQANLDFPNTAAQSSSDLTIALTGAATGMVVLLGVPVASQPADCCYTAFVSAANTVTVRFNNYSAAAIDPASGQFTVAIVVY